MRCIALRRRMAALAAAGLLSGLGVLAFAGAAQAQMGRLSLKARPEAAGVEVVAVLTDPRGRPVPDAEVAFHRRTAFGWLEMGRVTTASDGSARLVVAPRGGSLEVRAEATVEDQTVSESVRLDLGGVRALRVRPGTATLSQFSPQPAFISPYPPLRLLVTLGPLLAGVWLTYAVVVYQLYRIARGG